MATELQQTEETAIVTVSQKQAIDKTSLESVSLYDKVMFLTVVDQITHDTAIEYYKAALALEKQVHKDHDGVVAHWKIKWDKACDDRKVDMDRTIDAKKLAKKKADDWEQERERIRQDEERRLQEIARKKFEEEQRIAREAAEAEAKRVREQEEAERLRLAQEAEELGATAEEVTEILNEPLYEPHPVVIETPVFVAPTLAPAFQKSVGFSARTTYSAEGFDIMATIRAAVANPAAFADCLTWNQTAINNKAKSQKEKFNVPGCKLVAKRV
jgi:hypothetical protein